MIYLQGSPSSSIPWMMSSIIMNILTNKALYSSSSQLTESDCISVIASYNSIQTSNIQILKPEELLEWIINNVITLDKPIYKEGDI